jgi:DNA-binding transcriptional LysR family regulator
MADYRPLERNARMRLNMFESLDEVRTFVRVVELRSLSAAARGLRVSPNAVWRRLERIELRVGVRLIERTTRTLRVTEAGERVAARARRILSELEEAEREVGAAERLRGTVRVSVSSDVAAGTFLQELRLLLEGNPELRVELLGRTRLLEPVSLGVDIVVWGGPVPAQSSTVRRIGLLPWALAASPTYVARRGLPTAPAELAAHECLLAMRGSKDFALRLLDRQGEAHVVNLVSRFESDSAQILLEALHAGLGIGVRPLREVEAAVALGQLVRILPAFQPEPMPISLVTPTGRLRSAQVRAVADLLTRRLRWLAALAD